MARQLIYYQYLSQDELPVMNHEVGVQMPIKSYDTLAWRCGEQFATAGFVLVKSWKEMFSSHDRQ